MSTELLTILVLMAMFVIATTMPVNLGALALMAAFVVGTLAVDAGCARGAGVIRPLFTHHRVSWRAEREGNIVGS